MEQSEKKSEEQKSPQQLPPQCILQVEYPQIQEEEVSLMDYWRVIWPRRWIVVGITFCSALLAVIYSLSLPNIYRAEILLAPVDNEEKRGGFSAAIGNLGGLASLAGISLPGGGNIEETLAVLKSREFLMKFIEEKKLMPILFPDEWDSLTKKWKETDPEKQPGPWDAYRLFTEEILEVTQDKKTSLTKLAIEWSNAGIAADWGNELVSRINEYLRRQAIERSERNLTFLNKSLTSTQVAEMRQTLFSLIVKEQKLAMLANTQEEFALRVLDKAEAPDKKYKPRRSKIVVLATIVGGFFSLTIVFLLNRLKQKNEDDDLKSGY